MKKSYFKVFDLLVKWFTILVIVIAGLLVVPKMIGIEPLIVLTPSMKKVMPVGSVAFFNTHDRNPETGKIMAYHMNGRNGTEITVTHRVVEVYENGTYLTKGDENETESGTVINSFQTIGSFMFDVPLLGVWMSQITNGHKIFVICMVIALNILSTALTPVKKDKKEKGGDKDEKAEQTDHGDNGCDSAHCGLCSQKDICISDGS